MRWARCAGSAPRLLLLVLANIELEHVFGYLDDRLVFGDRADIRKYLRIGDLPALSDEGTPVGAVCREQRGRVSDVGRRVFPEEPSSHAHTSKMREIWRTFFAHSDAERHAGQGTNEAS